MGGRKIPESFRERMHVQEDAATLTRADISAEGKSWVVIWMVLSALAPG